MTEKLFRMKVTKYEHACVLVEVNSKRLVIDPGMLTNLPDDIANIETVVITHMHGDHLNTENLQKILVVNPEVTIVALQQVIDELTDVTCTKKVIHGDDTVTVGSFELGFYGHDHAIIFETIPCENVGVLVNKVFYYPGDSFTRPDITPRVVAVPASAPWMKTGEAMQFLHDIKASEAFPTHDGLLSEFGLNLSANLLGQAAKAAGTTLRVLQTGESIEIA